MMRSFLKKLALLVFTVVVIVVVVELVLRIFFPVYPTGDLRAFVYDDQLGYRLPAGTHELYITDHQEELVVNGLGTTNFQRDFSGYQKLVFAVGDSYTEGTGLPADMSYPAQLDLMLNRDDHGMYSKKFGVANLGLSGFGGEQELITLDRATRQIGAPAVITYLGCDNDHDDDALFASGYTHRHIIRGSPYWGPLVRPMQFLTNDLQIGLRSKLAVAALRNRRVDPPSDGRSTAELEISVLERLLQYAAAHNARVVVSWSTKGDSIRGSGAGQRRIRSHSPTGPHASTRSRTPFPTSRPKTHIPPVITAAGSTPSSPSNMRPR